MIDCFDFETLIKELDKDLDKGFSNIAEIAKDKWKQMIIDRFYNAYSPKEYITTYQVLDSLSILNVSYSGGMHEIQIGYDDSKIERIEYISRYGNERVAHEFDNMGWLFEYGDIIGHKDGGIRALDDMIKYSKSEEFVNDFKKEMHKLGYTFIK